MEIPLLHYKRVSFDQTQWKSCFLSLLKSHQKCLKPKTLLSKYCKWRNPFSRISCSCPDHGLKPRPKPIPSVSEVDIVVVDDSRDLGKVKRPSAGLCSQIEKMVLFGRFRDALDLFEIFEIEGGFEVGSSTYDALISACIGLRSTRAVKRVFGYMRGNGFVPDLYMRNRVLLMHVKCGMVGDAWRLFDEMPERNLVSWNVMITGFVDVGDYVEAFRLFLAMWEEFSDCESRTFATMIRASAGLGLVSVGRQLHLCTVKMGLADDMFVSCTLIDMYCKCGSIEDGHCVFEQMPEKSTVGWNSIIAGYALNGYSEEALNMYYEMRGSGIPLDHFTFSIIVRICARLASLGNAKQAHGALIRHGFGLDIVANTALVDFYSKWGRVTDARHVFDKMPRKNVISWNALIAGYGNHGRGAEAVELFERMLREKITPSHVTFLAVLSACSYSGLSEYGWEIFYSMGRDYKIKPRAMHYACMIELLGREGLLDEAFALIKGAPFKTTINMWAALLTACRVHGNFELGKFAAEKLYGMAPEKLNNYVVLLNIYNSSGKLQEAASVVQALKSKGLKMLPACSWIEVQKQSHVFSFGDKQHPQIKKVYQKVDETMLEISKQGYVPEKRTLLPDVNEQEERILLYHSEKLAIAFGLMHTPSWAPLQVVQGHRICNDCHKAIKLIAKVTGREIVVRDASRFHYFKDGSCSCKDYW